MCPFELGFLRFYVLSLTFPYFFIFLFFKRVWTVIVLFTHMDSLCSRQSSLFIGPTTTLFGKKFIKNGSHNTIHPFKNYLLRYFKFSVFSKNKLYPNGPYIFWKSYHWLHVFYILNTHVKFCDNRILFTIWCINLFLIRNFKLQKLAI